MSLENRIAALEKHDPGRLWVSVVILRNGERNSTEPESPPPDAVLCIRVEINRQVSTALVRQELQLALPSGNEHDGASQQYGDGTTDPVTGDAAQARRNDAEAPDRPAPQPEPSDAPGAAAGVPAGLLEPPAREVVAGVERSTPAVQHPVGALEFGMRQEDAAASRALWQDLQLLREWWLPVEPAPLGLCAVLHCQHPAGNHRGIQLRLPCSYCHFRAEEHQPDGLALEVPFASRRATPCSNYRAIHVDEVESDKCEVSQCGCRGWRRWLPHDPRSELATLMAQLDERDRVIAENEQKLARLRSECEQLQRDVLRAQGRIDNGPAPHGAPVYVEGASK